jgi:hypothetical protein
LLPVAAAPRGASPRWLNPESGGELVEIERFFGENILSDDGICLPLQPKSRKRKITALFLELHAQVRNNRTTHRARLANAGVGYGMQQNLLFIQIKLKCQDY